MPTTLSLLDEWMLNNKDTPQQVFGKTIVGKIIETFDRMAVIRFPNIGN